MKTSRKWLILCALMLSLAIGDRPAQAGGRDENPLSETGWFCPFCGGSYEPYDSNRSRQDTMRRYHHWMGIDNRYQVFGQYTTGRPLDKNKASFLVQSYIRSTRNPNLKLGGITAKDEYYEALIVTTEGSLVDIILVDKYTGQFRSVY